jgi:hypothetical protein
MGANGKWEFLVPVALAAAALLSSSSSAPEEAKLISPQSRTAKDELVLKAPALASHAQQSQHESHSSHRSHRSHYSSR